MRRSIVAGVAVAAVAIVLVFGVMPVFGYPWPYCLPYCSGP